MKDAAPPPLTPPDALAVSPLAGSWLVCVALAALLWALAASSAECSILQVPEEYPTIQSAVDAATSGDEIVLSDGDFNGDGNTNIVLPDIDLTIRSLNGSEFTSVSGRGEEEVYAFGFDARPTAGHVITFEGLTLRQFYWNQGSALTCGGSGSVVVERCRVLESGTDPVFELLGGAVVLFDSVDAEFRDCLLESNYSPRGGGAIATQNAATLRMIGCTIRLNWNTGIWLQSSSPAFLEETVLDSNAGRGVGGAFVDNGATLALNHCLLVGGGSAITVAGTASIVSCTISRNSRSRPGAGIEVYSTGTVSMEKSIVRGNCTPEEDDMWILGEMAVFCCALDSAEIRGLDRIEFIGEQVWADPLFCALPDFCPTGGHVDGYSLQSNSPCAAWRSPCGEDIGAFGIQCGGEVGACCVGEDCIVMPETECSDGGGEYQGHGTACQPDPCRVTPVVPRSWGRIKASFGIGARERR